MFARSGSWAHVIYVKLRGTLFTNQDSHIPWRYACISVSVDSCIVFMKRFMRTNSQPFVYANMKLFNIVIWNLSHIVALIPCFHFVFSYTGLEITTIKEAQKEMMCTRQMCLTCELSFGMRYVFSCSHLIISWYTVVGLIHRTVWCVLSGVERGVELCISGICPDSRWNWFLSPLSANSKKKLSVISEWPYLYQIYELLLSKKNDGVYSLWC